jgi:hypothetical protein
MVIHRRPVTAVSHYGFRRFLRLRDRPRWNGMYKSEYNELSRAQAHGPMRGATGCGRGVGGLLRHGRAGTSLSRTVPATAPDVRCQSTEGEEGQRSPAAMRPGRRHAAAMPPLMLVCMQIARTRNAHAPFRARGRQRVHSYSECASARQGAGAHPLASTPSPVLPGGDVSGGTEGGGSRPRQPGVHTRRSAREAADEHRLRALRARRRVLLPADRDA